MANVLVAGVYMADKPNTAAHLVHQLAGSAQHNVCQRWIALAPGGAGRFDLPCTYKVVTAPAPKFSLLDQLTEDALDFDWVLLCDDDVEVGPGFLDALIRLSDKHDFALSQPARTSDSFTDHPIVQVIPGVAARRTRFVEIGPVVCIRRDACKLLLPFGPEVGMGWGLDFVWPVKLEHRGLRMGILDATPIAHRIRRPAGGYDTRTAHLSMSDLLARHPHLDKNEAFTVLEVHT
ncbi:hypothetical protein NU688_12485 [Variovorax sp. ZS18.2.2]|uniref:hypothetical protein n=1 Tax=Variovorax sp. ZS18.2.2 TaxID=2971255 RepID=UPI0021513739|nr:hypothetical protein [Variovorax sp. ZS18.2.2]MCR6476970.1 hypothetical protein [Variovorax sp. ZS18.2.2]